MLGTYATPIANDCEHGINLEDDCIECLKSDLIEANKLLKFFRPTLIKFPGGLAVSFKAHNREQALKVEDYLKYF